MGGAARVEQFLSGWAPWSTCGRAAHAHGLALAAEAAGRLDEAALHFAEAADGWEAWGSVPFRAYALLGLGTCAGDSAVLAEGEAIFAKLAAVPVNATVGSGASAAGVGARRRGTLFRLGQLGGRECGAVENVPLGHFDLR